MTKETLEKAEAGKKLKDKIEWAEWVLERLNKIRPVVYCVFLGGRVSYMAEWEELGKFLFAEDSEIRDSERMKLANSKLSTLEFVVIRLEQIKDDLQNEFDAL